MTTDIELALAKGKVEGARQLLKEYYEAQDRQEFETKLLEEYELLEDKSITFEEYKNETKVVSEAIYENDILVTPEATELVRPYIAKDVTDRVEEYLKSKYAELRKKAYPPMEMFADAWVKNDEAGMEEYRRLCLEVKERFPK